MDSKPKSFQDALEQLEKNFENAMDTLKPQLEDAKEKVAKEVEKNPWMAIGVVAIISFLLGILLAPRCRRDD